MKRPIDAEGAVKRALTWKEDKFARSFDRYPITAALHRYAGRVHAIGCTPKLSAIDKRYFAEINHWNGRAMEPNIALGTGPTPLHAALTGYSRARPGDVTWKVFALELEAVMLGRAVHKAVDLDRRLDRCLQDLTNVLDMYRAIRAAPRPMPAKPDEDDDL